MACKKVEFLPTEKALFERHNKDEDAHCGLIKKVDLMVNGPGLSDAKFISPLIKDTIVFNDVPIPFPKEANTVLTYDGKAFQWKPIGTQTNESGETEQKPNVEKPRIIEVDDTHPVYPKFVLSEYNATKEAGDWKSTQWQIAKDSIFTQIIYTYVETDKSKYNVLEITSDILEPLQTYYVRARYESQNGISSAWSDPYEYITGRYILDDLQLKDSYESGTTIQKTVYHDNGRQFDTQKYSLSITVTDGSVDINGFTFTWHLPVTAEDKNATITVVVLDKQERKVSTEYNKQILVKAQELQSDDVITISDFKKESEYNDGWYS